jgi:septum formation protein
VARAKAQAGWNRLEQRNLPRAAVLAADTTVALGERILGKPADRRERAEMLARSVRTRHQVLTRGRGQARVAVRMRAVGSEVEFKPLSAEEIRSTSPPASATTRPAPIAIQGRAAQFVVAAARQLSRA